MEVAAAADGMSSPRTASSAPPGRHPITLAALPAVAGVARRAGMLLSTQKNQCLHVNRRMLKFVDLALERSKDRVRISKRMVHSSKDPKSSQSWKTIEDKHRHVVKALKRLHQSLKPIGTYLARHPNPGASRVQESEFAWARRQLQEEHGALVVCDARLGFELVRRENSDSKLYRKLRKARQAIRNILATYEQEISNMDEPSPPRAGGSNQAGQTAGLLAPGHRGM